MAEQQLVDYIKKAKEAGQSDDQTKSLLLKNGWTDAEVSDAFSAINPVQQTPPAQPQIQPQAQPQPAQVQPAQVQPQVVAQPDVNPEVKEIQQIKSRPHVFVKILIALIILAIIGGAGYFVAGQYFSIPFSFQNSSTASPASVVAKMDENMKAVKTYRASVKGNFSVANNGNLAVTADGINDITDINNPKSNFGFTANLTTAGLTVPVATANISAIAVNGSSYLMVNDATISAGFIPGLSISQIKGNWFKADQDSITALPQINILQPANFSIANKLQNLLLTGNIFSNIKQLDAQVINGQSTYHYSATISSANLNNFLNSQMPFAGSVATTGATTAVEFWIGKADYLLYQYQINETGAKIVATNSDFNKVFSIQAPASSQKIETILLPLVKLQQVQLDLLQVNSVAETLLSKNSDYSSLCKNGLLNAYLKMGLLTFSKDIVNQGAKTPMCFAGAQNYCVSSQLADGSWICVGPNGFIGKTQCASSATLCK